MTCPWASVLCPLAQSPGAYSSESPPTRHLKASLVSLVDSETVMGVVVKPYHSYVFHAARVYFECFITHINGKGFHLKKCFSPRLIFHAESIHSFDIFMTYVQQCHMFTVMFKLKAYDDYGDFTM